MTPWSPLDLLPGAYVALLATALALLLRRLGEGLPWRVWLAFGALLAALLWRPLVGGGVLLPLDGLRGEAPFRGLPAEAPHANPLQGDLLQLVAPSLAAVRDAYAAGEWPLWNGRVGAGMPLLADPQAQALSPLALLALPFPVERAAGVLAALRLLVALVFTHLWLRRRDLSHGAALCGAVAFAGGGFLQLWLGWPIASGAALLPAALWAGERAVVVGGRRDVALLAIAVFALATAGHPEPVLYGGLLLVLVTLAHARRRAVAERWTALGRAAAGATLGFLLAAPVVLPAAELLPRSLRAAQLGSGAGLASGGAAQDVAGAVAPDASRLALRLLPVAAPNAFGNGRYGDPGGAVYWGASNLNEDAGAFIGSGALLLAALALVPGRRRFPLEIPLAGAFVGALVVLADPAPLHAALAALPLAGGSAVDHQRVAMVAALAGAALAACELERWRRGEGRRLLLIAGGLGLAALVAWAYLAHPCPGHPAALAVLRLGSLRLQLKALVLAGLLIALAARLRGAVPALAVVLAWELLTLHAPANTASRWRTAPSVPALEYLRTHAGGFRVAALDRALPPNVAALYGLTDARLYDPAQPYAYERLVAPLLAAPRRNVPAFAPVAHPLYDLLGVRYLLAAAPPPDADLATVVWRSDDAVILARPSALPRLFLPARALPLADEPALAWLGASAEWRAAATVAPEGDARAAWSAAGRDAVLADLALGRDRTRALYGSPEPRLLAASVLQDGSWRVFLAGRPAPPRRVDYAFVGAQLPAGEGEVLLLYRPRAFAAGLALAALGLLAALLAIPPPAKR